MTGRDLPSGGSLPDGTEEERQHDQLERARRRRERDLVDRDRYAPQAPLAGASRRGRPGMAMGLAGGICVLAAAAGAAVVFDPGVPEPVLLPTASVEPSPSTSAAPSATSAPPATSVPQPAAGEQPPAPPPPPAGAGPGVARAGPDGPAAGRPGRGPR